MYIDYRQINQLTINNKYLLPRTNDCSTNCRVSFSKIDLRLDYINLTSKVMTFLKTLSERNEVLRVLVMSFRLTSELVTFMDLNEVLKPGCGNTLLRHSYTFPIAWSTWITLQYDSSDTSWQKLVKLSNYEFWLKMVAFFGKKIAYMLVPQNGRCSKVG